MKMQNSNGSKETVMSYDKIVEQLKSNILQITFTKVDGEQRVMPCTLQTDICLHGQRQRCNRLMSSL